MPLVFREEPAFRDLISVTHYLTTRMVRYLITLSMRILRFRMSQAPTKVINDGRVTIPAELRRNLGLEEGDYVLIDVKPLEEQ